MDLEKWVDKTFGLRVNKGSNVRHVHFDWNKIDESIYVGTNACCQYHFSKELLGVGINSNISLEEERLDMSSGVKSFLWLPTKDHQAPTIQSLFLGVSHLKKLIDLVNKVYVHCKNGHGRAPTLVAAYYIGQGKTMEEAVKIVETMRKEAHIEPSQKEALREYEKVIKS